MIRIGHGYDVHAFADNRKCIIGGVEIPYEKGLLGAAALGDIGKHFPDTDPEYKGADSLKLLSCVVKLIEEKGYKVNNIDATVIAQAPKLAPHILSMRENIAKAMNVDVDFVSVKATTEEKLGFTGRKEGISAHCVCLIEK